MSPYTDAQLEADLRAALDHGNTDTITTLTREIDRRDRHPAPVVTLLAAALWYAEHDLAVFPLQPGSKIPYKGSRGCKDASIDPDVVRAWWTADPDANIGLATGGRVDVVDIDGHPGQTSRARNWPMFDALTVLATVTTPRPGGMHLYVPAAGVGNKAGLLDGVDYRGAGGYVVAPPSRTDQGAYRFLTPLDVTAAAAAA